MSLQDHTAPPFDRGQTQYAFLYGVEASLNVFNEPTIGATVEHPGEDELAREHWFSDRDFGSRGRPKRSGGMCLCRAMRNYTAGGASPTVVGGFNLLPKRLVYSGNSLSTGTYTSNGGSNERGRAYGYVDELNAIGYPVDEFLPAAGVVPYDIFWVVVRGPATIMTDITTLATIVVGGPVVAQTAAASTSFTSGTTGVGGRFTGMTYGATGVGSVVGTALLGIIGRALTAVASTQTNAGMLINVNIF